jgi:hypothetical protein
MGACMSYQLVDIDKSKLFKMLDYTPHKYQQQIHSSQARYTIPCCGRRFGKSIAAGHEITARAMSPDRYIWIVGPTYRLGEKEFRVVHDDFVRKLKVPKLKSSYNVKQGDMRVVLPWNTVVEVVSAEKQDGLVGEGLDYACMSEAALHLMSTWQMYIQPALSDKRGAAIFPSTPRGNNWYKSMYLMGRDPSLKEFDSWRFPTWFNTVMFPGGYDDPELVRIRHQVSEHYWLQEYAAEFTAREGKIYKDWNDTIHVMSDYVYNPSWTNWLAIDFGFSAPFACYDIQVDENDNVYVWREYQVRHKTTWEHGHILLNRENPQSYRVHAIAADPRGADSIATLQLILRVPIMANPVPWVTGIEAVSQWLKVDKSTKKPKLFVSKYCPELIRQIEELQTPKVREGQNEREGQRDYDDHGPDALRYFFNEWAVLGNRFSLMDVYGGTGGYGSQDDSGIFVAGSSTILDNLRNYDNLGY